MLKKELRIIIKSDLKFFAKKIKNLKFSRKKINRNRNLGDIEIDILKFKYQFRHLHISYCIFFNHKNIDQIESTTSPRYNNPNINKIKSTIIIWEDQLK